MPEERWLRALPMQTQEEPAMPALLVASEDLPAARRAQEESVSPVAESIQRLCPSEASASRGIRAEWKARRSFEGKINKYVPQRN